MSRGYPAAMTVVDAPDLLAQERAEVTARIETMRADLSAYKESAAGSQLDDEHDPEGPTIAFERAQMESVLSQAIAHLAEIDAAAERVSAGTYGICERCEKPISEARLSVLPSTRYCVECAAIVQRTV